MGCLNHCLDALIELVVLIITMDHLIRIMGENPDPKPYEKRFEVSICLTLISEMLAGLDQQWEYFVEHSLGTNCVAPVGTSTFLNDQNLICVQICQLKTVNRANTGDWVVSEELFNFFSALKKLFFRLKIVNSGFHDC